VIGNLFRAVVGNVTHDDAHFARGTDVDVVESHARPDDAETLLGLAEYRPRDLRIVKTDYHPRAADMS
jgi:hypothetical protein